MTRDEDDKRDDALDPDAPPSAAELKLAESLRLGLEGKAESVDADFLRAVSLAESPRALPPEEHERMVEVAVARAVPKKSNVVRVSFVVATSLALAASVLLYFFSQPRGAATVQAQAAAAPLVSVRTTQPLFDKPFESHGASARIDRIAMARENDLRENRFSKWGVR